MNKLNPYIGYLDVEDCGKSVSCTPVVLAEKVIVGNGRRVKVRLTADSTGIDDYGYYIKRIIEGGAATTTTLIGPFTTVEMNGGQEVEDDWFVPGPRHEYQVYNEHRWCGEDTYGSVFLSPSQVFQVRLRTYTSNRCGADSTGFLTVYVSSVEDQTAVNSGVGFGGVILYSDTSTLRVFVPAAGVMYSRDADGADKYNMDSTGITGVTVCVDCVGGDNGYGITAERINGRVIVKSTVRPTSGVHQYMVKYMVNNGLQGEYTNTIGPYTLAQMEAGIDTESGDFYGIRHQYQIYSNNVNCGETNYRYVYLEPLVPFQVTLRIKDSAVCGDLDSSIVTFYVKEEWEKIAVDENNGGIVNARIYIDAMMTTLYNPPTGTAHTRNNGSTDLYTIVNGRVTNTMACTPQGLLVRVRRYTDNYCDTIAAETRALYVRNAIDRDNFNANINLGDIVLWEQPLMKNVYAPAPGNLFSLDANGSQIRNTIVNGEVTATGTCVARPTLGVAFSLREYLDNICSNDSIGGFGLYATQADINEINANGNLANVLIFTDSRMLYRLSSDRYYAPYGTGPTTIRNTVIDGVMTKGVCTNICPSLCTPCNVTTSIDPRSPNIPRSANIAFDKHPNAIFTMTWSLHNSTGGVLATSTLTTGLAGSPNFTSSYSNWDDATNYVSLELSNNWEADGCGSLVNRWYFYSDGTVTRTPR